MATITPQDPTNDLETGSTDIADATNLGQLKLALRGLVRALRTIKRRQFVMRSRIQRNRSDIRQIKRILRGD